MLRKDNNRAYWFGLRRLTSSKNWEYVDGVAATDANTNFEAGQPDNPDHHCAEFLKEYNYKFDNFDCAQPFRAICERR